jgi:hypothetical protein
VETGQDKNIAWKVALPRKGWSQPIVWGNKIFVTTAVTENQATPKAGKEHYSRRLERTKGFTSSPWGNDGKVICLDETGVTVVLKAGPKFEVLAMNGLDGMFWSSVAVTEEKSLLRGVDHLYCITR